MASTARPRTSPSRPFGDRRGRERLRRPPLLRRVERDSTAPDGTLELQRFRDPETLAACAPPNKSLERFVRSLRS